MGSSPRTAHVTSAPAAGATAGRRTAPSRSGRKPLPTLAMIVEANPSLARVVAQAQRAARGPGPILIEGAPGTGKATLARAIHAQRTERARPFVALEGARLSGEALRAARHAKGDCP